MALSNVERQRRYRLRHKEAGATPKPKPATVTHNGALHRNDTDPIVTLLESLPRVRVGRDGYSHIDRASDFVAVFAGTSGPDQGRRVLSQIHQICDPAPLPMDADKPGTMAFKNGMRRVMTEIMLCMVARDPVTIERS